MKIRLMGLPDETDAAVEALRGGFDVLEVSAPRRNRGDSALVRVYVEVRLSRGRPVQDDTTSASASSVPDEPEHLAAQLRRVNNVLGWARTRITALHLKRDKTPENQRARRRECDARAEEVQRLVDELDKALTEGTDEH
ncbi:hypothetical protein [Actinomadura madurae]|uniref:hypothetical protein n=1 Tax=Actinomadura madurae TaxID=1993 RepID=UPI0020D20162|nr:hypothetical protein [Actinomadura madurae]MCP9947339.1 hypothetical protein [Actinomadura madurae]MCP9964104.1 hypothetical protein [Actinomadura madurae]MCP9976576.1 hypothetical protein [Actinomadura madurae]MCQ0011927.1 hypothetical protein [Actinomadura madurae]MCQ0012772.1 hypothetical protein [Actinomadura madurae]